MSKIGWVIGMALALAPAGCGKSGSGDANVEPWCGAAPCPCKAGSETKTNGKTGVCTLEKPTTIQGLPIAAMQISFDDKGVLRQFTLASPTKIGDITCKAGGTIQAWGPGKLKSCYTDDVVEIDGIACTKSVSRIESGKLRRCQVAKPVKVGELDMPAKSWLTVYGSGKPERFEVFDAPLKVQGHTCTGGLNYMHENGKLKRCKLAEDETIAGAATKKGADVCFGENGAPVDCKTLKFEML